VDEIPLAPGTMVPAQPAAPAAPEKK